MATYITQTCGIYGGIATAKQGRLVDQARSLGILPISLYYYPVDSDTPAQLSSRLDGILSGISYNDHLIIQWPTLLGEKYEQALLAKFNVFRQASASQLIMMVNDVPALQNGDEDAIHQAVTFLNSADILILPSPELGIKLNDYGLKVRRRVYSGLWDYYVPGHFHLAKQQRLVNVFSDEITVFTKLGITTKHISKIPTELQAETLNNNGGFGMVWLENDYERLVSPISATTVLSSGLPILTNDNSALAELVIRHGLGICRQSPEYLAEAVNELDTTEYQQLVSRADKFAKKLRCGNCTERALDQAQWLAEEKAGE